MRPTVIALALGCLMGGGVTLLVTKMRAEPAAAPRSGDRPALSRAVAKIEELERTREKLAEQVRQNHELQRKLDAQVKALHKEAEWWASARPSRSGSAA